MKSKNEKIIHIHAKCKAFEFFEQIPEDKAVGRLIDIRDGFDKLRASYGVKGKLVVNTKLVNPELPFK